MLTACVPCAPLPRWPRAEREPVSAMCTREAKAASSPCGAVQSASDEALMSAYRAGDHRAFEQLVLRHSRGIYNFILRSVRSAARAEELLQEVLVRVIRSKDRYHRSAKFTTWVYTIARNLCVDESRRARFRDHDSLDAPMRRGGRRRRGSRLAGMSSDQMPTDLAAEVPRLRRRLARAVDRLPVEQREVFLMRQLGGLSFREIGVAVDAPENTVKSRMRYALEKLRQELADLRPASEDQDMEGIAHG